MIRTTGARFAGLALSLVAGIGLVGCGNGVEVRGPSKPSSAPVSSPTAASTSSPATSSPATSLAATSAPATSSPAGPPHRATHKPTGTAGNRTTKPSPPAAPRTSARPGGHHGGNSGNDQPGGARSTAPRTDDGQRSGGDTIAACGLGDLHVGVRVPAGGGAAGSQYVLLAFTNTSSRPCTMYGYAGVSFVGHHNGTQLGRPAVRDRSRSSRVVRVAPGDTRSELLQITAAGNFDPKTCQPTTSDGFRVYPPDSYTAAYVPFNTSACQGRVAQLTVYPVGTKS